MASTDHPTTEERRNQATEVNPQAQPTVAIDFDGVLHSYARGWTGPMPEDPPVPGARDFVDWLIAQGYRIAIVSSRCLEEEGLKNVLHWLAEHGFRWDEVTSKKVPAVAYLDDRAVRFDGDFGLVQRRFTEPARHLKPWTHSMPDELDGKWSWSTNKEYFCGTGHDNREDAAAEAAAELAPGGHYWTGRFRQVDLTWLAETVVYSWHYGIDYLSVTIGEHLCDNVGEAAEDFAIDPGDYALFRDEVQAALLRLLRRPGTRPQCYQVTDVEAHVVPKDREER